MPGSMFANGDLHAKLKTWTVGMVARAMQNAPTVIKQTLRIHLRQWYQTGRIQVVQSMKRFAGDVLCALFLNMSWPEAWEQFDDFFSGVSVPSRKSELAKQRILDFINQSTFSTRNDFGLSDLQIKIQLVGFMVYAGYLGIFGSFSSTLAELSNHPEIAASVHHEVANFQQTTSFYQLRPLLNSVFKETLRLHNPVRFCHRTANSDITLGGCMITEGSHMKANIFHTMRDPDLFTDPNKFNPCRFQDKGNVDDFFLAFGIGRVQGGRKCPAHELVPLCANAFFATLMSHARWNLIGHAAEWSMDKFLPGNSPLEFEIQLLSFANSQTTTLCDSKDSVCIIGAGAAGMSAALALSTFGYRVTVIEKQERVGGHACSVEHLDEHGQLLWSTDPAFGGSMGPKTHPNVYSIFELIGIETYQPKQWGNHYCEFTRGAGLTEFDMDELSRFLDTMQAMLLDQSTDITVGQLVQERGLHLDTLLSFLVRAFPGEPLDGYLDWPVRLWVEYGSQLNQTGGEIEPIYQTSMVRGGSQHYSDAFREFLEQHRGVQFMTGCDTQVADRGQDRCLLRVTQADSVQELECTHLVIATHPDQALELLGHTATPEERGVLGGFEQGGGHAVIHRDAAWMPPKQDQWASLNRVVPGVQDPASWSGTLTITRCNPCNITQEPVFVTYSYANELPIEGGVQGPHFSHTKLNMKTLELRERMQALQGRDCIHFAGSYLLGVMCHEDAMTSGLQAANRIMAGLHEYPIIPKWYELHAKGEWLERPKEKAPHMVSVPRAVDQAAAIAAEICEAVAAQLDMQAGTISHTSTWAELGLSSVKLVKLGRQLSNKLGVELVPSDLQENSTIEALSVHLADLTGHTVGVAQVHETTNQDVQQPRMLAAKAVKQAVPGTREPYVGSRGNSVSQINATPVSQEALAQWSTKDVQHWLHTLPFMTKYISQFAEIDGKLLCKLNDAYLQDLGVDSALHRDTFVGEIHNFKKREGQAHRQLTVNEVQSWLSSTEGLAQYADMFAAHKINGEMLCLLQESHLHDMGVKLQIHCDSILASIAKGDPWLMPATLPTIQVPATIKAAGHQIASPLPATTLHISIVGMACRLPGDIASPEHLWQFLHSRGCAVTVEAPEFALKHVVPILGQVALPAAAHLENVSTLEERCNPEIAIQVAGEALSDARLSSVEALFAGSPHEQTARQIAQALQVQSCQNIDEASTSSHLALHHAAQALLGGTCTASLVVGVSLFTDSKAYLNPDTQALLSPSNRVCAFDEAADGMLFGEGVAAVALHTNTISQSHGLLLGSVVTTNSAATPPGYPDQASEEHAIRLALQAARVSAQEISLVEMVANGTPMGDDTETHAVANVFTAERRGHPVAIAGFNANLGHPTYCCGLVSLIKAVVQMENQAVLPNIHLQNPIEPIADSKVHAPTVVLHLHTMPILKSAVHGHALGAPNVHTVVAQVTASSPLFGKAAQTHEDSSNRRVQAAQIGVRSQAPTKAEVQTAVVSLAQKELKLQGLAQEQVLGLDMLEAGMTSKHATHVASSLRLRFEGLSMTDSSANGAPGEAEILSVGIQGGTVVHAFRGWCMSQPDKVLYTWLNDAGKVEAKWTYRDVEQRADAVCHALLNKWNCQPGDRAVLMYLPGLDFIAAFWGCLIAGVVGVPVYPVDLYKFKVSVVRFGQIVQACEPKVALTHNEYLSMKRIMAVKNMFVDAKWPEGLEFEVTDELKPQQERCERLPEPQDLAFLQFTSGSTGDPKGVMVAHSNIQANIEYMMHYYEFGPENTVVTWLPIYHDMGLIGCFLCATGAGGAAVAMSPLTFLRSPFTWLDTLSRFKATHSAAPNFAYAMSVTKIDRDSVQKLDLAHVTMLMSAAEPIQADVVNGFVAHFQPCGIEDRMITPGYGLAEFTLVITCSNISGIYDVPKITSFDADVLDQGKALVTATGRELVSCGGWDPQVDVQIAQQDNGAFTKSEDGVVGEIWASGSSKAQGYWGKLQLSHETFHAKLEGTEYLRTGDLGFLHNGELYVCGRLKDLIIVRGRNLYPQDIERSVEEAHPNIRPGCIAAFSVEAGGEEQVVVLAEVRDARSYDFLDVIRAAVSRDHAVYCSAVVLLVPRTIFKTTSGKIQRSQCKAAYLEWSKSSTPRAEPGSCVLFGCCRGKAGQSNLCVVAARDWGVDNKDGNGLRASVANRLQPNCKVREESAPPTFGKADQGCANPTEGRVKATPSDRLEVQNTVVELVQEVLELQHLDRAEVLGLNLLEAGMTSTHATQLSRKLCSHFEGLQIHAVDVLERGTTLTLIERVVEHQKRGLRNTAERANKAALPQSALTNEPRHAATFGVSVNASALLKDVLEYAQTAVGRDTAPSPDRNLFEYGMSSLNGVDLTSYLSSKLSMDISHTVLWECTSAQSLVQWVESYAPGQETEPVLEMESQCAASKLDTGASVDDYKLCPDEVGMRLASSHRKSSSVIMILQCIGLCCLGPTLALALLPGFLLLGLGAELLENAVVLCMLPLILVPQLISLIIVVAMVRPFTAVLPGSYPLWSWPYLKWWYGQLLFRTTHAFVAPIFSDSIFMVWWLMLLGGRMDKRVRISVADTSCPELLAVGEGSSLTASVYCHEIWDQLLHIRPVVIGAGCSNGTGSVVLPGTVLEDEAHLMPLSSVCCATLPAGEWVGTPPVPNVISNIAAVSPTDGTHGSRHYWTRQLGQGLGIIAFSVILFLFFVPAELMVLYTPANTIDSHISLLIFVFLGILCWIIVQLLVFVSIHRLLVGKLQDGQTCHIDSFLVVRMQFVDCLGQVPFAIIRVFAFFTFKPFYANLLGASQSYHAGNVSDRFAFSTVSLIEAKQGSFCNGYCENTSRQGSRLQFHAISFEQGSNLALRSCVGGKLEGNCALGSLAWLPRGHTIPQGHTALGNPVKMFQLGDLVLRETVPRPTWATVLHTIAIFLGMIPLVFLSLMPTFEAIWAYDSDFLGVIQGYCHTTPSFCINGYCVGGTRLDSWQCLRATVDLLEVGFDIGAPSQIVERVVVYVCSSYLAILPLVLFQVKVKWLIMRHYQEGNKSDDEPRDWCTELAHQVVFTWYFWAAASSTNLFLGTPLIGHILRVFGTRIGRECYIDTLDVLDWDLLQIGEACNINANCHVICHVYQYGKLEYGSTSMGDGCNVGSHAQVVPHVTMEDNAGICAVTRAFAGEVLGSKMVYAGVPARKVGTGNADPLNVTLISKGWHKQPKSFQVEHFSKHDAAHSDPQCSSSSEHPQHPQLRKAQSVVVDDSDDDVSSPTGTTASLASERSESDSDLSKDESLVRPVATATTNRALLEPNAPYAPPTPTPWRADSTMGDSFHQAMCALVVTVVIQVALVCHCIGSVSPRSKHALSRFLRCFGHRLVGAVFQQPTEAFLDPVTGERWPTLRDNWEFENCTPWAADMARSISEEPAPAVPRLDSNSPTHVAHLHTAGANKCWVCQSPLARDSLSGLMHQALRWDHAGC